MSTFFTADTVEFSQNVSLYAETAPTPILGINSYDYYLNIYVDDCNLLFLARNYVENPDDRNLVTVNLLPDNQYIYDHINDSHIGIAPVSLTGESYSGTSALIVEVDGTPTSDDRVDEDTPMNDARITAIESGRPADQSFSTRLLEIMAIQIFNHAKTRAAIKNDSDFISVNSSSDIDTPNLTRRFVDHVTGTLSAEGFNTTIFNRYVTTSKYNESDIGTPVDFNFDTPWAFPIYFTGNLGADTPNELLNGVATTLNGHHPMFRGSYNIPIYVQFIKTPTP